jgi:hypothetical protein
MRLEGEDPGWVAALPRQFADPADQRRMAAVQAVEIAHREDRAGRVMRPGAGMSYDSDHGDKNRAVFKASGIAMKIARPLASR